MSKRRGAHHSTVPRGKPPARPATPPPPRAPRVAPPTSSPRRSTVRRDVARIIDDGDRTLVDVIDNLLNSGVVLNAELVLALADVDLVYLRLSALLCAADRLLPVRRIS